MLPSIGQRSDGDVSVESGQRDQVLAVEPNVHQAGLKKMEAVA